jgi:hypothetical protein
MVGELASHGATDTPNGVRIRRARHKVGSHYHYSGYRYFTAN